MKLERSRKLELAAAVLAALAASACHGQVAAEPDPDPKPEPDPVPLYDEVEPNDQAPQAAWFGLLDAPQALAIQGHIGADGFDVYDGFALSVASACTVEFRLHASSDFADLDLCVYDPLADAFVACFDSLENPEHGALTFEHGGHDFHLVVSAVAGASDYVLEIEAHEIYGQSSAVESFAAAGARAAARFDGYRRDQALAPEAPAALLGGAYAGFDAAGERAASGRFVLDAAGRVHVDARAPR